MQFHRLPKVVLAHVSVFKVKIAYVKVKMTIVTKKKTNVTRMTIQRVYLGRELSLTRPASMAEMKTEISKNLCFNFHSLK